MTGNGRRIRRRVGVSSYTRDNSTSNDKRKFQLFLMGGVIYLAIISTTSSICCIDAFHFRHISSYSSPSISMSTRGSPSLRRNHQTSPSHPHEPSLCHGRQQQLSQQTQYPFYRLFHKTFLQAEANSNQEGGGTTKSSATAAMIDATVDAGGIAAMDPEYQRYKKSLLGNGNDENEDTDETKNEKELYQDFANFYSSDFEDEKEDASDTTDTTAADAANVKSTSESKSESKTLKGDTTKVSFDLPDEPAEETPQQQQQQQQPPRVRPAVGDISMRMQPLEGFNVVLTHCTADFDSLASAVGLAKLWTSKRPPNDGEEGNEDEEDDQDFDISKSGYPTFVVLPRGAHPAVQRFLALHKHLFPIRSLKSLPQDLSKLHRLALVDAQRKDRIGPAETLLQHADRITVVDHHVDMESDIPGITDYVVDGVGSVSTLIVERLMRQQEKQLERQLETSSSPITTLTEAEATLLALGIHADTGSLCFDSTTPRDASALAWVMHQGASQVAIAEHAQSSLSREQQTVLTQALVNANSTVVHGVTVSTVLLTADGFINGLAAVTQDAMELSSADVFLLGVVYEPKAGRGGKNKKRREPGEHVKSKLLLTGSRNSKTKQMEDELAKKSQKLFPTKVQSPAVEYRSQLALMAEENRLVQERLRASFDQKDLDGNGFIDRREMSAALVASGIIATEDTVLGLMTSIDTNRDGLVDFDEFAAFATNVKASLVVNGNNQNEETSNLQLPPSSKDDTDAPNSQSSSQQTQSTSSGKASSPSSTLIIIGRAKPGVNMKSVKLGKLLEKYGGGGHPKAASATVRLEHESQATEVMSGLVDELIETSLQEQPTVGDFMTSPVLSVKSDMSENQVEDLFNRYDVRALPVVNEDHEVIGLVTYKEVAAAKQRAWNKEQKRLRQEAARKEREAQQEVQNEKFHQHQKRKEEQLRKERAKNRRKGPTVKAWMKQHIKTVEASMTMAEVEAILLENDVGCIPVVMDGTQELVGMVTRTDLLRQHRYYPSLHYNNKGMSDSLASRKHIVALRKKLKQFDLDE